MDMLSEHVLMRIVNFKFCLATPKVVKCFDICINGMLILTICLQINMVFASPKETLRNLMNLMVTLSWVISTLTILGKKLNSNTSTQKLYSGLLDIDSASNSNLSQRQDWTLLFLSALLLWEYILVGYICSLSSFKTVIMMLASFYTDQTVLRLAMVKHAISKRLKHLRTAEEYLEQVEDMIHYTQKTMECDAKLNTSYGLILAVYSVNSFSLVVYTLYTVWEVYGAGLTHPDGFKANTAVAVVFCCSITLITILTATLSSNIADEIREIKLELDISWSARQSTDIQMRMIYLFLMELHHKPGRFLAFGFFEISRSSLCTACAVATSYLLVLIQYT